MKLLNIIANNFLSYENLSLDLNKNMCLIEGWNYDENSSNGSGKSSIIDAITYCIYGEIPRKIKTDEVINNINKKECKLELEFELNNENYKIVRTRKPNDLYIIKENNVIRGKDIPETQDIINDIIKIDFKTFINSIYLSQNGKSEFIGLTDIEKQKILTELMDLSIFDRAYALTNDKLKEISLDIDFEKIKLTLKYNYAHKIIA